MKKTITQKDYLGCGLACVAFVVGKNYESIKRIKSPEHGLLCKEIVSLLAEYGLTYKYSYLKSNKKNLFENGDIVFVKKGSRYPAGHYLVKYENRWMDPWVNFNPKQDVSQARSGYRKRLPGKAIYKISST